MNLESHTEFKAAHPEGIPELEKIKATMEQLRSQLTALSQNPEVSAEEQLNLEKQFESFTFALDHVGEASKREQAKAGLRQEMFRTLGEDYEEKMRSFIKSLDTREGLIVQSIINDTVPDIGHAYHGGQSPENVFARIIKRGPAILDQYFEAWSRSITRGLGTKALNPETGKVEEVTQENWRLGPRGQWYKEFQNAFKTLGAKIEQLTTD